MCVNIFLMNFESGKNLTNLVINWIVWQWRKEIYKHLVEITQVTIILCGKVSVWRHLVFILMQNWVNKWSWWWRKLEKYGATTISFDMKNLEFLSHLPQCKKKWKSGGAIWKLIQESYPINIMSLLNWWSVVALSGYLYY